MRTSLVLSLITLSAWVSVPVSAHEPVIRARTPIRLPEVPGYVTLKCDFHIHTVFSDGLEARHSKRSETRSGGLPGTTASARPSSASPRTAIGADDHVQRQRHQGYRRRLRGSGNGHTVDRHRC